MKTSLIALVAFLLGGGAGVLIFGFASEKPQVAEHSAASADDKALVAAKKRIAELESALAKCRAPKAVSAGKTEAAKEEIVLGDGDDIRAALKKNLSSEEFVQATNAFERLKVARQKRMQGKIDFLSSVDTSRWSSAERENHEEYAKLFARQQEIAAKMKGGIPDQKSIGELVNLQLQMKPRADAERKVLLRQLSADLGYVGEDAAVITDTVGDIIGATSAGVLGDAFGSAIEDVGGEGGESKVEIQTLTF